MVGVKGGTRGGGFVIVGGGLKGGEGFVVRGEGGR